MHKAVSALVIIVLLAASGMLAVYPDVKLAMANPSMIPPMPETPDLNEPKVIVKLPEENKTYNTNAVPYSISVEKPSSWFDFNPVHGMIMTIDYIMDGDLHVEIADEPPYYEIGPFAYEGTLSGLSEGNHTLEVYVRSDSFYDPPDKPRPQEWPWGKMPPQDCYLDTYSGKVYFAVDTTPPAVSILFLNDTIYSSSEVPLSFSVDESTSRITYCVDNVDNATVLGNCTLSGLSNGRHSLTIYAWDIVGNVGISETVTFTVDRQPESTSKSETFPISPVATGSVVVAAVVALGFLVYLKKRERSVGA
jgi:hypothetical protein